MILSLTLTITKATGVFFCKNCRDKDIKWFK